MLLAPSDIHFLRDSTCSMTLEPDGLIISDLSAKIVEQGGELPKIQVAEKDGSWFALNNSYLHVFRELERQGKCVRIKVDVVPLTKVPQNVQKGMLVTTTDSHEATASDVLRLTDEVKTNEDTTTAEEETDPSRVTKRGYHKLSDGGEELKAPAAPEQDANSSYSGTDYSDCGEEEEETDSEFDETLTCNVCDRSFNSTKLLAQHQQKKRHFGCSVCESIFPTLMTLEHHKEILDHWSEDEGNTHDSESDDATDDEEGEKPEELERLL